MKTDKNKTEAKTRLRTIAEQKLSEAMGKFKAPEFDTKDIKSLIHELQVFTIELELQNEELSSANYELESSRNDFSNLFDYAPVGYLILNKDGIISNANLTICTMLGYPKERLLNDKLYSYVRDDYKDVLFKCFRNIFSSGSSDSLEINMITKKGTELNALLKVNLVDTKDSKKDRCRISVSDITDLRNIENEKNILENKFRVLTQLKELQNEKNILENRFQIIAELTSDYTYEYKINKHNKLELEWVSGAFEKITGFSFREIKKAGGWINLVHPEDVQIAKIRKEKLLNGCENESEYRIIGKDNSVKWLRDFGKPIIENGKIILIVGGAKDITNEKGSQEQIILNHNATLNLIEDLAMENEERRIAEESLRKSEQRFRQITDSSRVWIWEVDAKGMYTYVSSMSQSILGYLPEEIIGKKYFYDFFPPEVKDELKNAALMVISKKGKFIDFENLNIHKDGSLVYLEKSAMPMLDDNGNLIGYRGADKDITDRKMVEKALIESEEKYRSVAQSANDAIVTADANGIIIDWNNGAEKIFGYLKSEIIGKPLTYIMPETYKSKHQAGMKRIENTLESNMIGHTVELEGLNKNGNSFPLELSIANWEAASVKYFTGIIRDITKRKETVNALKQKMDELEKFNTLMVGREIKMIELKKEINDLLVKIGERPKYDIDFEN